VVDDAREHEPARNPDDARQRELARNLAAVRARLDAACVAAGREPSEVSLIVVTKTFPASDVIRLASLGVIDIGENRDQEAAPKAAEVAAKAITVRWHFVGQLQRNKCRSVVRYADVVHSVDSVRLAQALGAAARRERERPIEVLVQVSLDGDATRGGAIPGAVAAGTAERDVALDDVVGSVASEDGLSFRGLMAVAPVEWDPGRAFADLASIAARIRVHYPHATVISAGMSGDVEQAIRHGATHVRLGSAVLGNRASLM
jgi:PLP dependent protein